MCSEGSLVFFLHYLAFLSLWVRDVVITGTVSVKLIFYFQADSAYCSNDVSISVAAGQARSRLTLVGLWPNPIWPGQLGSGRGFGFF